MQKRKLMGKQKSETAFRTIREVAERLDVQQHVLRFWETKFTQIQPVKRSGGRRYYRPEDVAVLDVIHNLLHVQGYTIKGAQKLIRGKSKAKIVAMDLATANKMSQITDVEHADSTMRRSNAGNDNAVHDEGTGFSDKQRAMLKAMLGELKALRAMVGED